MTDGYKRSIPTRLAAPRLVDHHREAGRAPWSLGGGPVITAGLLEFLDRLEDQTGAHEVTCDDWREGNQVVAVSDISRAHEALDWKPRIDFEAGVERFVGWYGDR